MSDNVQQHGSVSHLDRSGQVLSAKIEDPAKFVEHIVVSQSQEALLVPRREPDQPDGEHRNGLTGFVLSGPYLERFLDPVSVRRCVLAAQQIG